MSNEKNNSILPIAIIGLVLIAAIGGGWWLFASSKSQSSKTANSNSAKKPADDKAALELYRNAPPGAQPISMLGSPTAPVVVEEFADYQCPTCGLTYPKTKELNSLYGNRIKFVYRNFPLQMHKYGYDASVAAEAAGLQGKLWEMQNQLFTNQTAWSNAADGRSVFADYAQKIGLDVEKFKSDMAGLQAKTRVDADMERGRKLNVNGTPTIFINGVKLLPEQMEVNAMKQLIDAELQKTASPAAPSQPANQPANN